MSIEIEVVTLRKRVADLEQVIRDVEGGYSENWDWAERHYDVLKTIPDFAFATIKHEKRWALEQGKAWP